MAHIPIHLGGGGGSGSDDCTAKKADVLKGTKAIFYGSDDEPEDGGMENYSGTIQSATAALDNTSKRLQMTIPATGKYDVKGKLYATFASIVSLIGLTADKLWPGTTILDVKSSRSTLNGGTYTPSTVTQQIACQYKVMNQDIVINPIPKNYYAVTDNPAFFRNGSYGPLADLGARLVTSVSKNGWNAGASVPISGGTMVFTLGSSAHASYSQMVFGRGIRTSQFKKIVVKGSIDLNFKDARICIYRKESDGIWRANYLEVGGNFNVTIDLPSGTSEVTVGFEYPVNFNSGNTQRTFRITEIYATG